MPINDRARIGVAIAAVVLGGTAAACTADRPSAEPMNMAEAGLLPDGTEVVVEGFVIADGDLVVVAELLAESFPPQPGGDTMTVDGFDIGRLDFREQGPVRWTDRPVSLAGTVEAGRLVDAEPVP